MTIVKEYIPQYSEYVDQIVIQWSLIVADILPRVEREIMKYVRVIKIHGKTKYFTTEALTKLKHAIIRQFQILISEYRAFVTLTYGSLCKYGMEIKDGKERKRFFADLEEYFYGSDNKEPLYERVLNDLYNAKDVSDILKCFKTIHRMLMDVGTMLAMAGLLDISRRKIDLL